MLKVDHIRRPNKPRELADQHRNNTVGQLLGDQLIIVLELVQSMDDNDAAIHLKQRKTALKPRATCSNGRLTMLLEASLNSLKTLMSNGMARPHLSRLRLAGWSSR